MSDAAYRPNQSKQVVAFNPNVRYHVALPFMPHMIGKKHHVREVCAHYGISSISDAILFDDDEVTCLHFFSPA